MKNSIEFKHISIDDLSLDKENPRFGKLYSGGTSEKELIEYLLFNEAAEEIAESISKSQKFYQDKALWVIKKGSKYIVKDGNRRCASLKALIKPEIYGLNLNSFSLDSIPVYLYNDENELNKRISEEHAGNLFRKWERIAKAIEILRLHNLSDNESVKSLDSKPGDLIKLASFYEEASKVGGEDLNKLLRRGKGKTGGKTIIFERMFKYRKNCGYDFKIGPNFRIKIVSRKRFDNYIQSIVDLLIHEGDKITTDTIDKEYSNFKKLLKNYGFNIDESFEEDKIESNNTSSTTATSEAFVNNNSTGRSSGDSFEESTNTVNNYGSEKQPIIESTVTNPTGKGSFNNGFSSTPLTSGNTRYSKQTQPKPKRKGIKPKIMSLIKECYMLDKDTNPNAKLALSRVTFECILKFVVEETNKANGKLLKDSKNLREAYFDRQHKLRKYVEFDILKNKFTNAIKDPKIKNAFTTFDLHLPHQIIHNYLTSATPQEALTTCENLMPLIEFMLQEENDLLNSLDDTLL